MSTPSPEKDSLLGPTVHKKIEYQNLKGDVFFAGPFTSMKKLFRILAPLAESRPGAIIFRHIFTVSDQSEHIS